MLNNHRSHAILKIYIHEEDFRGSLIEEGCVVWVRVAVRIRARDEGLGMRVRHSVGVRCSCKFCKQTDRQG